MIGYPLTVTDLHKTYPGNAHPVFDGFSLDVEAGSLCAVVGVSGVGKTTLLNCIAGLDHWEGGRITVGEEPVPEGAEARALYRRRRVGLAFQQPHLLPEFTVRENLRMPFLIDGTSSAEGEAWLSQLLSTVGLGSLGERFPSQLSGGEAARAGLARALVLDPKIILCDEPDSGLDPVRTAYLSQLIIDINAQIDATVLIVTHNINIARTVPDNMGMLFRRKLIMFGPREVLLTSDEPVVRQFLNGRRIGPIGMSEEKDEATMAEEQAMADAGHHSGGTEEVEGVPPQIVATPGMPERQAVARRQARVREMLHTLPKKAQAAILDDLEGSRRYQAQ